MLEKIKECIYHDGLRKVTHQVCQCSSKRDCQKGEYCLKELDLCLKEKKPECINTSGVEQINIPVCGCGSTDCYETQYCFKNICLTNKISVCKGQNGLSKNLENACECNTNN